MQPGRRSINFLSSPSPAGVISDLMSSPGVADTSFGNQCFCHLIRLYNVFVPNYFPLLSGVFDGNAGSFGPSHGGTTNHILYVQKILS